MSVLGDRTGDSRNWARWNPDWASIAEEGALDSVAGTSVSVLGCRRPGMTAPQASETPSSLGNDTILITGLCSYHLGRQTRTVLSIAESSALLGGFQMDETGNKQTNDWKNKGSYGIKANVDKARRLD